MKRSKEEQNARHDTTGIPGTPLVPVLRKHRFPTGTGDCCPARSMK